MERLSQFNTLAGVSPGSVGASDWVRQISHGSARVTHSLPNGQPSPPTATKVNCTSAKARSLAGVPPGSSRASGWARQGNHCGPQWTSQLPDGQPSPLGHYPVGSHQPLHAVLSRCFASEGPALDQPVRVIVVPSGKPRALLLVLGCCSPCRELHLLQGAVALAASHTLIRRPGLCTKFMTENRAALPRAPRRGNHGASVWSITRADPW
jgi:hypothetical protein